MPKITDEKIAELRAWVSKEHKNSYAALVAIIVNDLLDDLEEARRERDDARKMRDEHFAEIERARRIIAEQIARAESAESRLKVMEGALRNLEKWVMTEANKRFTEPKMVFASNVLDEVSRKITELKCAALATADEGKEG